jgi:uncharacterized membrane protein
MAFDKVTQMPVKWNECADGKTELVLWPHRSLPRRGFAFFILGTCLLALLPMLAVLGTPVLWGVLPFFALAIGGLWLAFGRNYRDAELHEVLTLSREGLNLRRVDTRGAMRDWSAEPYWVKLELHEAGGPVPQYLTLAGGGRVVELGAFLSPDERVALAADLRARLAALR